MQTEQQNETVSNGSARPAFGPKTTIVPLGRKRFALSSEMFKGALQVRLQEVSPRTEGLTVTGWDRVFNGTQLSGSPDALSNFLRDARDALHESATSGP